MFKRILVPTDGSPGARKAAQTAFELARSMGASVLALRVVPPDVPEIAYTGFGVMGMPVPLGPPVDEPGGSGRDEALSRLRRSARREGVHLHAARVTDPLPVDAIARAAERLECDLIVMCSRGFGRLIPALTGDVSGSVFRRCEVPMLLVHAEQERAPRQNSNEQKERRSECKQP